MDEKEKYLLAVIQLYVWSVVIMSFRQSTTLLLTSIRESLFLNNALFTKQQNQKFKFPPYAGDVTAHIIKIR